MTGNKRIIRFSTGTVDIHPQHAYRGKSPQYRWILTSRRWLTERSINVYVIEHSDGLVVFDTGQERASITDPTYFPQGPVGLIYRRLARFDIPESELRRRPRPFPPPPFTAASRARDSRQARPYGRWCEAYAERT